MIAQREFPPNPHAVVYHVDHRLTDEIVETYLAGADAPRPWAHEATRLPGLRVLSINAYKVRLQKRKSARWSEVLDGFERILRERLRVERIDDLDETECRHRKFSWHGEPFGRRVFEGLSQARQHPVAGELFELPGISEVILDGHHVQLRKTPLYSWAALTPRVERVLGPR